MTAALAGIPLAPLAAQDLPATGRPLLAWFDDATVVLWQAHAHAVADELVARGFGGGPWRLDRTTRFRLSLPSLLARNDWATRPGRERILAVRISRTGFESLLRMVVHAEQLPGVYASAAAFRLATRYANVTVHWHPDRDPCAAPLERSTPRFALRDHALATFTHEWVVGVEDVTGWVTDHRAARTADLAVPLLRPYPLPEPELRRLAGT